MKDREEYISILEQDNAELKKELEDKILLEMKLEIELFNKRKEYQETYKDVRMEIKEYKNQLEDKEDFIKKLQAAKDRLDKYNYEITMQQQEFINWLEAEIKGYEAISDLLFNHNKELKAYKEILSKYKEIIGEGTNEKNND